MKPKIPTPQIGQVFRELTVLSFVGVNQGGHKVFLCRCSCGKETQTTGANLNHGNTNSCGHLLAVSCGDNFRTHGESKTPLYRVWKQMRNRCHLPTSTEYIRYGARGISVCDEWNTGFETFRDWSVANGYQRGLQIDRINNDGNYEPDNCRWTTRFVQANNRRTNVKVTAFGETKTSAEWARDPRCKVRPGTLRHRASTLNWPGEVALTQPSRNGASRHV